MTRVGVVGAGITGLALTHFLAERGLTVVTLESTDEPGGVIRSTRQAGTVLEHGPQRLRVTGATADLLDEYALQEQLVTGNPELPLYVYVDGRLREVPKSVPAFLSTDLLSWRGKFRAIFEPFTAPIDPGESVATAFERKFGREVGENIIDPLVGGIYASETDQLPAGHAIEPLLRIESREGSLLKAVIRRLRSRSVPPPATFREGLQSLPEAIADSHADSVRLDEPVEAIEAVGDGYSLRAGSEEVVDIALLTPPAPTASSLLHGIAPGVADALDGLTYNPLAVVHLRSAVDREGFGYQVRSGQGLRTLGVTWNASLFDRDGLYTCFLGGMRDPEMLEKPRREIGEIGRREFETVMGARAEVLNVTIHRRALPAYDRSWDALAGIDLPAGLRLVANYTGRLGIPSRIREAERVAASIASDGA